jgi:hypothetical protein
MPVVKDGDEMGQTFDPNVWPYHPIMPETFVPYYESYIPVACAGHPERLKLALRALADRDQRAIERALFPKT